MQFRRFPILYLTIAPILRGLSKAGSRYTKSKPRRVYRYRHFDSRCAPRPTVLGISDRKTSRLSRPIAIVVVLLLVNRGKTKTRGFALIANDSRDFVTDTYSPAFVRLLFLPIRFPASDAAPFLRIPSRTSDHRFRASAHVPLLSLSLSLSLS